MGKRFPVDGGRNTTVGRDMFPGRGGGVAASLLPLVDSGPRVRLRSATDAPYDDAIAAARTCYSERVVAPEEITERQRDSIGPLTYGGGHHTVFQHATFEFELSGVSRQLVWSVLHGFPFYNTEQQSQRYVKLGTPAAHVPPELGGHAREVYTASVERGWAAYRELTGQLAPLAREILGDLWHLDRRANKAFGKSLAREAEKKAIETARYVIPSRATRRWSTRYRASCCTGCAGWRVSATCRARRRA
jgi:thymidylate synthase ThyX